LRSKDWPYAPYQAGGPVSDDIRFVDRENVLGVLRGLVLESDQPGFVLRGPRRSGKSSVLERTAKLLDAEARVVRVNLLSILGYSDSWPANTVTPTVLESLYDALELSPESVPRELLSGPWLPEVGIPEFRRAALPILAKAAEPRRLLILLDEMEVAQARDPHSPREIVAALQPLSGFRHQVPFLGIVWGRGFGKGLPRDVPSPLKDFPLLDLARFQRPQTDRAVEQPLKGIYAWSERARDLMWSLTRGHPLFIAALGAAVHSARQPGDCRSVQIQELNSSIEDGLDRAETWSDAWRQLNRVQQIFLRALAENPGKDIESIIPVISEWAAPYEPIDIEPFIKGLVEDELIAPEKSAFVFQVEMIRRWIERIDPNEILSSPEDLRDTMSPDSARQEREGRRLYQSGELGAAARSFQAAVELDPGRASAAVWLGETLLELDRPGDVVKLLRGATPTPEVHRARAKALVRCLENALDTHEDPTALIAELRAVDPYHQEVPQAAQLIARIEIEEWRRSLESTDPRDANEATDKYVLPRTESIFTALRRIRAEIESALVHRSNSAELTKVIYHVVPYLLRQSEPIVFPKMSGRSDGDVSANVSSEWELCYTAEVSAVSRFRNDSIGSELVGIRALSLLELLRCRASAGVLGIPLRSLILELASADRLTTLALSDPAAAKAVALLLQGVDRLEGINRLQRSFSDAALAASIGAPQAITATLNSLPSLGHGLIQMLQHEEVRVREAHLHDIVTASGFLIDRIQHESQGTAIMIGREAAEEWCRLLANLTDIAPAEVSRLQTSLIARLQDAEGELAELSPGAMDKGASRAISAGIVQEVLGPVYRIERAVPYRIHGVPPGYVWAWSVDRVGRNLLARAYRVEGGEPSIQAFLGHLWENERRLLATLGTRWEGRALPRLHIARFEPARGILVLVTDFIGPQTLRDLLTAGEISKLRRVSRATLWRHLHGIIDALAALHRSGYIHRAVRPENIMVDSNAFVGHGRQWLRLANFEWSIYLYGISTSRAREARLHDRYVAPERLALHRTVTSDTQHLGEGTASDVFALGLVLFECLVEPLNNDELAPIPASYGPERHLQWISRLLERVDEAFNERRLWSDEVILLKSLLRPEVSRRCADVEAILDTVSRLAQQETPEQAAQISTPLQLVTALELGTSESITRFIKEEIPEISFDSVAAVASWIQQELQGAQVRPNRRAGAPLLLLGRSLNFTVEAFAFLGAVHRHVGWLKVAKTHDAPAGSTIGLLECGVEVHNHRRDMRLAPLLTAPNGWEPWFSAVEQLHENLNGNERAFIERVRWSIELERASWARQVFPYEIVEYQRAGRPGDRDTVIIRDSADPRLMKGRTDPHEGRSHTLADLMAQAADRQNTYFELSTVRDPTAAFHPGRRWIQESSDLESGIVRMMRYRQENAQDPPDRGWIRPYSLAGHRAIYERRKDVLADVQRDPYLVRSLIAPQETFDDLNLPISRVFDSRLDADKIALCQAIQNRRPLFVVQGPPGTGKTTLAAEVILRTLHEQPSSRILVVAQAHDPLNNLLERVEKALDGWQKSGKGRRPSSVRLASEERLDESRYGAESTRVPRRFHPSRVAAKIIENASAWRPGPEDVSGKAFELWRHMCETQAVHGISRSLERRLVASANLVYATANDRRLATLRPGSFDFVIYEETAKAFPAEVLGPLRLARRWLLIGDQAQLPPFGLDEVDAALKSDINNLRREHRRGHPLAADARGVDPISILGEGTPAPDMWAGIYQEMVHLLHFFDYIRSRAARVPLTTSLPPDVESARAVKGLSGMLTTQWRMHPVIGDLISKCFYKGDLRNGDPERLAKWRRHGLVLPEVVKDRAIVWLDIPWVLNERLATERHGFGGGYENGLEARVVFGFLRSLLGQKKTPLSLAIMSPYRAQISALARLLQDFKLPDERDLSANLHTADSFQGKQADIVVVSLVRNRAPSPGPIDRQVRKGLGFLEHPERSTVIFSRAERLLVVVGCLRHFKQFTGTRMYDVAQHIETLARNKNSEVAVVSGTDFVEPRFWEALKRNYQFNEERQRRQNRTSTRRPDQESRD
jgi:serine/threonine protein kinase